MGCNQSKKGGDAGVDAHAHGAPSAAAYEQDQSMDKSVVMYDETDDGDELGMDDIAVKVNQAPPPQQSQAPAASPSVPPPPAHSPPPIQLAASPEHSRVQSSNVMEGWEDDQIAALEAQMAQQKQAQQQELAQAALPPQATSNSYETIKLAGRDNYKTFRPPKQHRTLHRADLHKQLRGTLNKNGGTMNADTLKMAVKVPTQEDVCEWHAVNVLEFYNDVSLLFGVLEEDLCVPERKSCAVMSAGPHEYLWADGVKVKKPKKVSAPEYMGYMMDWAATQLDDPRLFPQQQGRPYPADFNSSVKVIFKRLFRAYAHFYHAHFDDYVSLGMQDHMNKCFRHFMLYVKEFDLVSEQDMEPLKDFIPQILKSGP